MEINALKFHAHSLPGILLSAHQQLKVPGQLLVMK
jgi:hypothetical protein